MKHKGRKQSQSQMPASGAALEPVEAITPTGKKVIFIGIVVVALGFLVLSRADPMGRNWASFLSPFLIIGGYGLIGLGIFLPDYPSSSAPKNQQSN